MVVSHDDSVFLGLKHKQTIQIRKFQIKVIGICVYHSENVRKICRKKKKLELFFIIKITVYNYQHFLFCFVFVFLPLLLLLQSLLSLFKLPYLRLISNISKTGFTLELVKF